MESAKSRTRKWPILRFLVSTLILYVPAVLAFSGWSALLDAFRRRDWSAVEWRTPLIITLVLIWAVWTILEKLRLRRQRSLQPTGRSYPSDNPAPTVEIGERPVYTAYFGDSGGDVVFPVWFGSNRFGTFPEHLAFGRVDVVVPKAHRFGETGSSFWTRLRRLDLRNDHLSIERIVPLIAYDLWEALRREMEYAREAGDSPQALLFIHGYNCSFDEAATRAAQIGFDLKIPGATAFFNWPSRGTLAGYAADAASIEGSEAAITKFLIEFAQNCGADKIHIIAHSMGNRGLLRSLHRIFANAEKRTAVRFGQIFLAAPDVDRNLFLGLAHVYSAFADRTTLYSSNADFAVHLSAKLYAAPRAGYFLPYTVAEGIDTVAVPSFNIDLLGHAYFAQAEALLHDMHDLIRHNEAPRLRQRLEPLIHGNEKLWRIRA